MAELFIAKNGDTYPIRDNDGHIKCLMQFPQVAIAHRLALQLVRLEQEFGLTPSARSRLQVTPPTEKSADDTERFFNVG